MAIGITFEEFEKDLKFVTDKRIYISNPYNKKNGEEKNVGRTQFFNPEGLFSEVIFGPINNYKCSCGLTRTVFNDGVVCEVCGVVCTDNQIRNEQFAKIQLPHYTILPTLIKQVYEIFGQIPIKQVMDKSKYNYNKYNPYYYNVKLQKLNKPLHEVKDPEDPTKKKLLFLPNIVVEDYCMDYPVFDIISLYKLFDYLRTNTTYLDKYKSFLYFNYIFLDFVLVSPPNSRPVMVINSEKTMTHPITAKYVEILNNLSNSNVDSFAQHDSQNFGFGMYKYQQSINELYELILQKNFQQKENISRNYLLGKIVENSGRCIIVPDPSLPPDKIGLPSAMILNMNQPELGHFLYQQVDKENEEFYGSANLVKNINKINSSNGNLKIDKKTTVQFLKEKGKNFIYICERPPVLWKYNNTAFTLGNITFNEDDSKRKMVNFTDKNESYRKNRKKVSEKFKRE